MGLYLTKDTCEPCGNSTLEIELLKDVATQDQHCCHTTTDKHNDCENENACTHNTQDHKHHQENYYLRNDLVFIETTNSQEITPQVLAVILPFLKPYLLTEDYSFLPTKETPLLPESKDSYRTFLCTYLL